MKTKRNKKNRKINRKTKQTRNKRIKYGAGDFRRRSEFNADEAMRPLIHMKIGDNIYSDFEKGGLMSMESLITNVAVLDISKEFIKLIEKEKIRENQPEKIIKATGKCMLETLGNHLQIGKCIRIGPNTPDNSRYRMGANNIVCIIEGDFTDRPLFALRVCMNRFPIDYISITYLEELKIFAALSQHKITPEVYYGGLCLTNYEYSAPSDSAPSAPQEYHFYSLTEAFEMELFKLYNDAIDSGDSQHILDITRVTVNDLIDRFSHWGMNCDCRSTNFVVNSSKNGEGQVIVTKMRMIDIDQTYYLSIKKLAELFQTDYIVKYVDGDVHTFAKTFANFAMKYLFWLEICLSGFTVAEQDLMELFQYMESESNKYYKILFLFLFLNTVSCYKAINVIYKIKPHPSFLFGDYAFSIIESKIQEIEETRTRTFSVNPESNKKIIEEFHSILFPESNKPESVDEPESVFAKIPESVFREADKSKSPDSKRTRRTNTI
jgi:hypothetical protein